MKSRLCSEQPTKSAFMLVASAKNSVISPPRLSIRNPLGLIPYKRNVFSGFSRRMESPHGSFDLKLAGVSFDGFRGWSQSGIANWRRPLIMGLFRVLPFGIPFVCFVDRGIGVDGCWLSIFRDGAVTVIVVSFNSFCGVGVGCNRGKKL